MTETGAAISEAAYLKDMAVRVDRSWPRSLPREACYPLGRRPLPEYVSRWARERPGLTAVNFYGREISFAELDRLADGLAAWLAGQEIGRGDRVALFLPSCPQFMIAFLAILKAGAVAVPVNTMAKEMELAHLLTDSASDVVIADETLAATVSNSELKSQPRTMLLVRVADFLPDKPDLPIPATLAASKPDRALSATGIMLARFEDAVRSEPVPLPEVGWDDLAVINYTGGTTGLPKGCIHSHGDLIYTAASSLTFNVPSKQGHVFCSFLPMFWIGGEIVSLLWPLVSGSTIILLSRWDAETVMKAIDRYGVTTIALMVDGAIEILDHPRRAEYDLSSLRNTLAVSFVEVLNPAVRARWKASVGTVLRESAWGMTETNTMDTFTTGFQEDDLDLSGPPTFVGLPMPGTEFKIVDPESGALLPPGNEGELHVRTPSLFKGYWNSPEATAAAVHDGWLNTADTAIIDERGLMTFRGRRREMLKVNGMSVFPSEVEALLMRHPAVSACGVTGRRDPAKGEVPVAFVLLKAAAQESEETLAAWCRRNIAVYKLPEIRLVQALPLTPSGKVKRAELKALL